MKTIFLATLSLLFSYVCFSQAKYWQQEVNFTINVSLNDKEHTLEAFETIEYINNSPDTLDFIWFHLWPNAYKNDKTFFSEQLLTNGTTDFYFSKPEERGYINQLQFKADNIVATTINDSANIDIIKLVLPLPLAPGSKTIITTPFHVKLPYNFSRGGHIKQDYQVTQWFPKPAVYDSRGWHPMPYANQGEFYSEFGSFDVQVTVPSSYVVAATGILQDEVTLNQLKQQGKHTVTPGDKTWSFKQGNIHDFAWFASKDFMVIHDTIALSSGKVVDVFSYFHPAAKDAWKESLKYAKDGIKNYSSWLGDYPYAIASIVQGDENKNSGGMEYPTITLITTQSKGHELDATIVHEVGHNWLYGALANNERDHAWMDEGINTYYQKRYELKKYNSYNFLPGSSRGGVKKLPEDDEDLLLRTMMNLKKDQPVETPSVKLSEINYGLSVYIKAGRWMSQLEQYLGTPLYDSCMHYYYRLWKFRHPYPEDFRTAFELASGRSLEKFFNQLYTTGPLEVSAERKTPKPSFLFNLKNTGRYNYINFLPVVGYNNYDKLVAGAMVHNYQLPLPRLQFLAGGTYAKNTKLFHGFGRVSHNTYKKNYNLETALSGLNFTQNRFTDESDSKLNLQVSRIVPSVKLTLFGNDPLQSRRFTVQWKTYILNEEALNFETIIIPGAPPDTLDKVTKIKTHPYINQLSLAYENNRVLYPYSINFVADQGKEFVRLGLTGRYYFNYSNNKTGLSARFFAGKFLYLNNKTFQTQSATSRYHLNMTGPSGSSYGSEDYTYSNYYIGRNEFEGWMSQQLMERDGFFKVRTDLLIDKVGKTDDWLMSLNLVTDFPANLNPLSVLPVKIPIKIFFDAGTYAEAWKDNPASGRFLYDAGLQLSLFKSVVNIYLPLIYSKVYSNYFKSYITEKRFQKNISFSIDLQKIKLSKIIPGVPL